MALSFLPTSTYMYFSSDVLNDPNPSLLTFRGRRVGNLLLPGAKLNLSSPQWQTVARSWDPPCFDEGSRYITTGESILQAYVSTLLLDRLGNKDRLNEWVEAFVQLRTMIHEDDMQFPADDVDQLSEFYRQFSLNGALRPMANPFATQFRMSLGGVNGLKRFCQVTSFCQVTDGYFAMVTEHAQEGDVVFLVRGSCLPVVLRRANELEMKQGGIDEMKETV